MNIEMLSTGDEVLFGQIIDTNAAWCADYLYQQGWKMTHRSTVGDTLAILVDEIHSRSQQADVLIVNGGLGPTSDDFSALAASQVAQQPLVLNQIWLAEMEQYFRQRGQVMAEINRKQAMIPATAEMLPNLCGTACGFYLQINQCHVFFTPGPPREFQSMIIDAVLPKLNQIFGAPNALHCLRLTTFGRGESDIASQLATLNLPDNVMLGYRAASPIVEVKLSGSDNEKDVMLACWQIIRQQLAENALFEGTQGMAATLVESLTSAQCCLAFIEGFTAGKLCLALSNHHAPLKESRIYQDNTTDLQAFADKAEQQRQESAAELAVAISGLIEKDNELLIVIASQRGQWGQRLRFTSPQSTLALKQELISLLVMKWLDNLLNQRDIAFQVGSVTCIEQLDRLKDVD